jgi:PAS domain S-box-containing protein
MPAIQHMESRRPGRSGGIRKLGSDLAHALRNLRITEKIFGIVAAMVVVLILLVAMSVQSLRLQTEYRQALATSATAAINIGRVNALIYAIVMESRGIYMSPDLAAAKPYADELVRRTHELAGVVTEWEKTADLSDEGQFLAFKQRILQFIDFRNELVRRTVRVSPAAGRAWGDNDANRALRSQLNVDLEAIAKIYDERATLVTELADRTRLASWYLALLGLSGLLLAALNVVVVRRSVIAPLSDIAKATDSITAGNIDIVIPHVAQWDEIGHLARAVRNFRDAVGRNFELEQLELGTAKQRDAAMDERNKLTEKYHATKWQLSGAINSMPQGIIMLDAKAEVLAVNDQYRKIYGLPPAIRAGSSLQEILQHRADSGLFPGDVAKYLAAILARMTKRQPTSHELTLSDGRVISIHERPMDGSGWVVTHEDTTEQRRSQRILERTEQFLATIIENIPEGIVAKDARNLRYVFVNRAAEKMIGMSRIEIMGKTARELFAAETADLIERRDRQLLEQKQQLEPIIDTVDNPVRGRRTVAFRRLQIGGPDRESHLLVSMFEDRADQANVADVAA